MRRRKWWSRAALLLLLPIMPACQVRGEPPGNPTNVPNPTPKRWNELPPMRIDASREYTATLSTTMGDFDIRLLPKEAPIAVNSFVFLAREGFYEDVKFHRIMRGFMIQTGDPTGTGGGGPGYRFQDEPVVSNYDRGVVAMANAGPDTNGSQFFIVHGSEVHQTLPKNYTIFGRVARGIEVVDSIAAVPVAATARGERSVPQTDVRIKKVTIKES